MRVDDSIAAILPEVIYKDDIFEYVENDTYLPDSAHGRFMPDNDDINWDKLDAATEPPSLLTDADCIACQFVMAYIWAI